MTLEESQGCFPDCRLGRWWKGVHRGMHVRKEVHRGNADSSCTCIVLVVPLGYLSSCSEARSDSQEGLLR